MKTTSCSIPLVVLLFLGFVLGGCGVSSKPDVTASDTRMNGELAVFLEKQVAKYGGQLSAANITNAPLNCSWRFRSDTNGAQVFIDAKLFPEVDHLFRASLGFPDIATTNQLGQVFVGYNIRKAGVAIQYATAPSPFSDFPDPLLHIIILKQQSTF